MRTWLALALGFAPMVLLAAPAQAQNYPWCAEYSMQGSSNCGFSTIEQCQAALSGNGGYCAANPMYRPGGEPLSTARKPRR